MPLTRRTRASGNSIIVTIPSQLTKAYDINCGDPVIIIPSKYGEIIIRRANGKDSLGEEL